MSQATRELLRKARKMVPPMLEKFHKGVCVGCYDVMEGKMERWWIEKLIQGRTDG